MKNLILIFIAFLGVSNLTAQDSSIVFSSRVSYLPSSYCRYEYYVQNGKTVKHKYEKESKNCWELNFNKGRKTDITSLRIVSEFIKDLNKKDTLIIFLHKELKDSLNNELLTNSKYIKNDSLTLIFSKFETEFYKPDSVKFPDSTRHIILPRIDGIQIDGNWLSTNFVINQDTLLSVHKSYSGYPRVSDFKQWLSFYLVCNKFKLFQDLEIKSYMSDNHYLHMLELYLKTMKN